MKKLILIMFLSIPAINAFADQSCEYNALLEYKNIVLHANLRYEGEARNAQLSHSNCMEWVRLSLRAGSDMKALTMKSESCNQAYHNKISEEGVERNFAINAAYTAYENNLKHCSAN